MTSGPLRTVVVSPAGDLGGAELYLLQMLDATRRLHVRVVLLADGPLRCELENRGIEVIVHPVGASPRELVRGARRLRHVLDTMDPDVVLTNGIKAQVVAGPAGWALGIPTVWIKHDHSYDRTLTQPLARIATKVVATADAVADAVGVRDDVVVIEPPRAAEPLPREEARRSLAQAGLTWDPLVRYLVMSTRLTPYKGVDVAIEALGSAPGWDLVVMGTADLSTPDEGERLVQVATSAGVADRVHFLGYVPGSASLLEAFDALAVLTRRAGRRTPGREGFGMSAMEAMVAGLPVVAPDDGGSVARRVGRDAGVLVDAEDAASVAAALCRLSSDTTRRSMAQTARVRSQQHQGIEELAGELVEVLVEAAKRPGAGIEAPRPVSVVSPVLNEMTNLDRLVPPVLAQMRDEDEFILVDSGSQDGTRERLRRWSAEDSRLRLLEVGPGSIGASRNRGVAAAEHDVIVCTDAGCQPEDDWLEKLRCSLAEEGGRAPDLVIGTYRVAVRPGRLFEVAMSAVSWPDPQELRRAPWPVRAWLRTVGPRFDARRVDGRSLGFTREAHRRAGGFPEDLLTAEDEAFGRAVLDAGGRTALLHDATVTWWQRDSVGAAFRQFRGYGRGGGTSRSGFLLAKDLVRAGAYGGLIGMLGSRRRSARWTGLIGMATILVFPAHRVVRRGQDPRALLLLPFAQGVRDGAKLVGTVEGLVREPRARPAHRPRAD